MSDLPRLLLCCFDVVPAPTAISRRMTEYLKGLSDRFQVIVLSVKTPDHTHIERYHGARLLRVPVGSGDLAARVQSFDRAVRRQLDSEEYVMVHSFDPFGGYALCERRSEFGYKIVYDASALPSVDLPCLHDEAETNRRFIAKVRRQELFCLMNADQVIVANDLTRDFVTGLGVAREQVLVLPPPVDLAPYRPEVMGTPDATPMKLLHLGNLSTANDLQTVLEAMQVALQSADLTLTIVGPRHPAHQARLEETIATLKLTGKVDFQDPVGHDDLHKVLATADVGLLSLADIDRNLKVGSPLSRAAEYLAAGRPVLAADVASARATLPEDGVVLYPPGDKASLAEALVSLASEPARRVKLGTAARGASIVHDGAKIRADLFASYVALTGTGIRAVGDADTTSPDEPTQLGKSLGAEDTKERRRREVEANRKTEEPKATTDPAMAAADTSPEAALADRPAVMGVPIREEEPPIVMGSEARDMALELAVQVTTEPNGIRPTEPPVVMGMPLPTTPADEPSESRHTSPTAHLTPGDLAAAMLEDEPLTNTPIVMPPAPEVAPTGTESAAPSEPPALAEALPDTGAHLSLVPTVDAPPPLPARSAPPRQTGTRFPVVPLSAMAQAEPRPAVTAPIEPVQVAAAPAPEPRPQPVASAPHPPPPSAPVVIPPLEMPGAALPLIPPVPRASASGLSPALKPTFPITPAVARTPDFVPLLTTPVSPATAPQRPPPLRTTSGTFALLATTPGAESSASFRPSPESSASFKPTSESPAAFRPASESSASFKSTAESSAIRRTPEVPGAVKSGAEGPASFTRPAEASASFRPTAPPALPVRSAENSATVRPAPPPLATKPSGLFPEAPRIPYRPPEAEAIREDEIEEVGDDGPEEVDSNEITELPAPAAQNSPSATGDEAPEVAAEDAAVQTVETDASPPPSAIDPWLAMLVHGYCPPESGLFNRHTPPTTMPGRDT